MINPLVSIVLLNWNGTKFIFDCIDSIRKQTYTNLEVILVDNNSKDGSIEKIENDNPDFIFIKNDENLGFAKAMNIGIEASKGDFVIPLNYDIYMHRDFIKECVKISMINTNVGVVGGQAYDWSDGILTNRLQNSCLYVAPYIRGLPLRSYSKGDIVPSVHGSFPFIRRKALDDIHNVLGEYYDPDFVTSWEDTDLWLRIKILGWDKIYWPDAKVWHYGSAAWDGKKRFIQHPLIDRTLVLRNRAAIIIQNIPLAIIMKFSIYILSFDIATLFYYLFFSRSSFVAMFKSYRLIIRDLPLMIRKRRLLMKARVIDNNELIKMFKNKTERNFDKVASKKNKLTSNYKCIISTLEKDKR